MDTLIKEHPILFSGPMVLAIRENRKHVTRRLSKRWLKVKAGDRLWVRETWRPWGWREDGPITVQFQADGTTMWDRASDLDIGYNYEEWYERICVQATEECAKAGIPQDGAGCYVWPGQECPLKWRPGMFLPRWCSRILLECEEDARLERLQDITREEVIAEGVEWRHGGGCLGNIVTYRNYSPIAERACDWYTNPINSFHSLWRTLHTKPGERWQDNPEVVRVGRFHIVKPDRNSGT